MSFMDELKKIIHPYDDEDYDYEEEELTPASKPAKESFREERREERKAEERRNKVVNIHATTQLKVVLVKPERFEDASTIADHLNNKRTVVLNLESTNKEVSRRLVDFLSGVAYANNGQITMARSIDPVVHAVRGFVPARTDEERFLMRHIEDLARTAQSRGIARYSGFLSDREQELARAALGRAGLEEGFRFDGGWPEAERRILCLAPEYSYPENPICCVQLQCRAQAGAVLPAHKDYLGSLMGLEIRREALGDIVLPPDAPGTAYVFALEPAARLICQELLQAGRTELATRLLAPDEVPEFRTAERRKCTATVSSLRLDAVLAAMLHCSRGQASELVTAGRVEINHLPAEKPSAPVYEGDVFTVRGKGRFALTALPGKSKKERLIIEFFQY